MDTVIGIRFNDFVLVSAAGIAAHYYIKLADNDEKMVPLDTAKLLVCSGDNGPRAHFCAYLKANYDLVKIRQHGVAMTGKGTALFVRQALASALRSRDGAFPTNVLLATHEGAVGSVSAEKDVCPHLFWVDYLGTLQEVPYGAHGYGATFVMALLDRYYEPTMAPAEGSALLQKCIDEVKRRVIISTPHFISRAVTRDGIQQLTAVA